MTDIEVSCNIGTESQISCEPDSLLALLIEAEAEIRQLKEANNDLQEKLNHKEGEVEESCAQEAENSLLLKRLHEKEERITELEEQNNQLQQQMSEILAQLRRQSQSKAPQESPQNHNIKTQYSEKSGASYTSTGVISPATIELAKKYLAEEEQQALSRTTSSFFKKSRNSALLSRNQMREFERSIDRVCKRQSGLNRSASKDKIRNYQNYCSSVEKKYSKAQKKVESTTNLKAYLKLGSSMTRTKPQKSFTNTLKTGNFDSTASSFTRYY